MICSRPLWKQLVWSKQTLVNKVSHSFSGLVNGILGIFASVDSNSVSWTPNLGFPRCIRKVSYTKWVGKLAFHGVCLIILSSEPATNSTLRRKLTTIIYSFICVSIWFYDIRLVALLQQTRYIHVFPYSDILDSFRFWLPFTVRKLLLRFAFNILKCALIFSCLVFGSCPI